MTLGELHQSLEDHLDVAGMDPDAAGQTGLFRVDNLERADWAVRRIAKIRRRQADAHLVAEAELQRVTSWLHAEDERAEKDQAFLLTLLEDYHRRLLDDDPKHNKTIHLPAGTLKAIKQVDRWDIDADDFIDWAMTSGYADLYRVKPEVDRQAAKRFLKVVDDGFVVVPTSGETVPGVTVVPGVVAFTVKTDE